uniref:Uncharacterized protein n=1 Tax=Panagrolaimus sp. ES5 TaxID=591445 RepID=A0AC34FF33_9BILA
MFDGNYSNITENFADEQEAVNERTQNYFYVNPLEAGIVNAEISDEQTYREVPMEKIIVGCNLQGSPNRRIIVPEEDDENYVREYTKLGNTGAIFYCIKCHNARTRIVGKMKDNIFQAPLFHVGTCFPILKVEAEERLRINNEKLQSSSSNNEIRKKTSTTTSKSRKHSTKERIETMPENDVTEEPLNRILKDLARLDELAKKREELARESERLAKRRKMPVRSSEDNSLPAVLNANIIPISYKFNHPSTYWLENVCKKLELTFSFSAYCLWAEIQISQFKETSKPQNVQYFKSGKSSGFRALSYLLSGSENKKVKNIICKYFFDNFKSLGIFGGHDFSVLTHDSEVVKKFIFAEQFTPELWEITAKWLNCRIGIFENTVFIKHGDWCKSDDTKIITLLFKKENENYSIVKSLTDQ